MTSSAGSMTWGRPEEEEERETTLFLVRHGETVWNVAGRVQGQQHSGLTQRGREQGRRAAQRLAGIKLDAIYASDLPRAQETAELIAAGRGLKVTVSPALRERSFGVLEGKTLQEAARTSGSWFLGWQANRLLKSPPDGERQPEMCERVMEVMRRIIESHAGGNVAIATHGGPIKSVVYDTLRIPMSLWSLSFIANGSITTLRGTVDVLRLVTLNDICHLEGLAPGPSEALE